MTVELQVFNHPQRFIQGWYWAIPSQNLKRNQVKEVTLLGRELAIYRSAKGSVVAVDAYCPHMGAHLAEGNVEGEGIRCFFHHWKYDAEGNCVDIPCFDKPIPTRIRVWPTAEQYGLIWVWTGSDPGYPPPFVPELEGQDCETILGAKFIKDCHPNVVMINAIDAQHFNSVHQFPVKIVFQKEVINRSAITFSNMTRGGQESLFLRLIRPFYQAAVTYTMSYWYASTGTVTVGPDFQHFHIMFALRLINGGKTEGQTILVARRRKGLPGWVASQTLLAITRWVGNYFAKGDTQIFRTIKFDFKTPTLADRSIVEFIDHTEAQLALDFGSWDPVGDHPSDPSHSSHYPIATSELH